MAATFTVSPGMQENILGEIVFTSPRRFTYYWVTGATMTKRVFYHVTRLQAMYTGCTVLHCKGSDDMVVLTPTYAYVIEALETDIPHITVTD